MVLAVTVADRLELEVAVKASKPPSGTKKQLGEGRMDVEVVFPLDVI